MLQLTLAGVAVSIERPKGIIATANSGMVTEDLEMELSSRRTPR